MRYGYWMPVFGGWLRNVDDENMAPTWEYNKRLAQRSEQIGFDLSLVAELNLNDIKGEEAPSLDAWSTAAALTAVTREAGTDGRGAADVPQPGAARQAGREHRPHRRRRAAVAQRRLELVEGRGDQVRRPLRAARRPLRPHRRVARAWWTACGSRTTSTSRASTTGSQDTVLQPKPVTRPRPVIYAGGESEAAKNLIAKTCDAYVMHGDPPERIAEKIADMAARRERFGLPPMIYGVAAYSIVRNTEAEAKAELARITDVKQSAAGYHNYQQWLAGTQLEQRVSLEDYSVSNRGLRRGPGRHAAAGARPREGVRGRRRELLLLQCSPQLEEMERFADQVIRAEPVREMATMTIEEWWSCTDPTSMLSWNQPGYALTDRRLRLLVCEWCRISGLDDIEASRNALEVSERYADGSAGPGELLSARMALYRIIQAQLRTNNRVFEALEAVYAAAGRQRVTLGRAIYSLPRVSRADANRKAAQALRDMVNIPRPQQVESEQGVVTTLVSSVLRFLSGHPGHPKPQTEETPPLEPCHIAMENDWFTSTAVAIARGAYQDRAFDRLPILADALQDAGCDNDDILTHLRDTTTPHVRGCWALDLVLGKS